jgi:hypothetical protein
MLAWPGGAARATDAEDLDVNLPTVLQDARVEGRGDVEAQAAARYDDRRRRGGGEQLRLFPRLQLGLADGLQVNIGLPYTLGWRGERTGGEANLGLLYRLNHEGEGRRAWLPAFALGAEVNAPVGPGDRGTELRLVGVASRTVHRESRTRLHLNLAWIQRFDPGAEERRERWRVVAGVSRPLWEDTALVANILHERQEVGERAGTILEAGLRWSPGRRVAFGAAVGTGIGPDSPRFRAALSLQVTLQRGEGGG